jgi:hypothetical protein
LRNVASCDENAPPKGDTRVEEVKVKIRHTDRQASLAKLGRWASNKGR